MQRLIVVGLIFSGLAFGMTACGSKKASAPTIKRANGTFFARVENKREAREACKMQRELGLQIKNLSTKTGVELVEFQYGQGTPMVPSGVTYAYAAGDFSTVSKNVAMCGVAVS